MELGNGSLLKIMRSQGIITAGEDGCFCAPQSVTMDGGAFAN